MNNAGLRHEHAEVSWRVSKYQKTPLFVFPGMAITEKRNLKKMSSLQWYWTMELRINYILGRNGYSIRFKSVICLQNCRWDYMAPLHGLSLDYYSSLFQIEAFSPGHEWKGLCSELHAIGPLSKRWLNRGSICFLKKQKQKNNNFDDNLCKSKGLQYFVAFTKFCCMPH